MTRSSPTANVATMMKIQSSSSAREECRSYFDGRLNRYVVSIWQGECHLSSKADQVITTVLGSCVAVCIRDPDVDCAGMNHFLLPDPQETADQRLPSVELRYGSYSIERLINGILSRGGRRDRLEIKVFGGANVLRGTANIGHRNADFVEDYLRRERLPIAAQHLRGVKPRKIRYYTATGQTQMCELRNTTAMAIFDHEANLQFRQSRTLKTGGVAIFDR